VIPKHRILYDEDAIRGRIEELAGEIAADLGDRRPVLLGLMMGSFLFLGDLIRALARRGVEPRVDLLGVSHYGLRTEPGGEVRIDRDTSLDLSGEAVIVIGPAG
jgi:hypoxanthine phosphoribosyltransferase